MSKSKRHHDIIQYNRKDEKKPGMSGGIQENVEIIDVSGEKQVCCYLLFHRQLLTIHCQLKYIIHEITQRQKFSVSGGKQVLRI